MGELIVPKNNTITILFFHGYYLDFIDLAFKLMMISAGYTRFWEDIKQLMEKGRKSSQPPRKTPRCVVEPNLMTKWYGLHAVPPGRTECRRHRLIKWSNFCEDTRDIFSREHLHSRHEQRRRDPEKKARSLIFTATPLLKNPPLHPPSPYSLYSSEIDPYF